MAAVLGTSSSATGIWWHALTRSILEKTVQPDSSWEKECRCGSGYLSGAVTVLR